MESSDAPGFVSLGRGLVSVDSLGAMSALALRPHEYHNHLFGVSFSKPSAWYYLAYREFLNAGATTPGYEPIRELVESQGTPIVVIAKHRETPPDFSPSIVLYAEILDDPEDVDLLDLDFSSFARTLDQFELQETPSRDQNGSLPASRHVYTYRQTGSGGNTALLRTTVMATLRDGIVYSFNFTDVISPPDLASLELDAVRRSVRFHEAHAA